MNLNVNKPHTIRLRGPWDYHVLAVQGDSFPATRNVAHPLPLSGKVSIPADWGESLGAGFRGRVAYTRHFNRPTGLADDTRVDLVLERVDARGLVRLNGETIGTFAFTDPPLRIDIAPRLLPRNELVVEVELIGEESNIPSTIRPGRENLPGGLIGEVRLEIFQEP